MAKAMVSTAVALLVFALAASSCGRADPNEDDAGAASDVGFDAGERSDAGEASQYSYPGCPDSGLGCRYPTLYCALEKIIAEHATCLDALDCEFAAIEARCSGFPRCPGPAVNRQTRVEFEARFNAEIERFCPADGGCFASEGHCQSPPSELRPACVSGTCRAELIDGGM